MGAFFLLPFFVFWFLIFCFLFFVFVFCLVFFFFFFFLSNDLLFSFAFSSSEPQNKRERGLFHCFFPQYTHSKKKFPELSMLPLFFQFFVFYAPFDLTNSLGLPFDLTTSHKTLQKRGIKTHNKRVGRLFLFPEEQARKEDFSSSDGLFLGGVPFAFFS